jgi:membrane-associated protease RseP (regulator of RpoE activity)
MSPVKNLSGPINIAEFAGFSARQGILSFLSFLAIVSVSLFVLNLLPIPILDGGQVVYQLAEVVKGSPAFGARPGGGAADRHPAAARAHELCVLQRPVAAVQLNLS